MATVIDRKATRLTDAEKIQVKASKTVNQNLGTMDAAGLRAFRDKVNADLDVLFQEGDGKGKRFPGAKSHDFADQALAYNQIATRGMIPTAIAAK